jgi:amino acid transporter
MHGTKLAPWGVRLQNTLGAGKLLVLSAIAISGLLCLAGVPGFQVREGYEVPDSFSSWEKLWEGSSGRGSNAFVTGLFGVTWSFIGYANANYALSEIRDPVRTIKRAIPLAMCAVTSVYLLINVAYFAAVSKADIIGSKRIIA